jgi:GntR family transcriptional repressor for pyruvate dehydrogenase complex
MMELGQIDNSSRRLVASTRPIEAVAANAKADLWEAIEAREVLETSLARLAAYRRTESDRARLDEAVARMRAAGDDRDAFNEGDFAFHVVLSEAAHNDLLARRLAALHDQIQEMIALFSNAAFREGGVPALVDAHARLAGAVSRGDADEAPQIVSAMMASLRDEARSAASPPVHDSSTARSTTPSKGDGA